MKKRSFFNRDKKEMIFIISLIILSLALYVAHYFIFKDLHHIGLFALSDLAFVPIEVIFVSLILHRVIESNDREKKLSKLYMVIEAFFSEVGSELLRAFATNDIKLSEIQENLIVKDDWTDSDFRRMIKVKRSYKPKIAYDSANMSKIKQMLNVNRFNMLRMLENPALLEHETFTELLMAVFHLGEELALRDDLYSLPKEDQEHLEQDAVRAYILLGIEWVDYIAHMRNHYPYLYSLAIRVNPFEKKCNVIIRNKEKQRKI